VNVLEGIEEIPGTFLEVTLVVVAHIISPNHDPSFANEVLVRDRF